MYNTITTVWKQHCAKSAWRYFFHPHTIITFCFFKVWWYYFFPLAIYIKYKQKVILFFCTLYTLFLCIGTYLIYIKKQYAFYKTSAPRGHVTHANRKYRTLLYRIFWQHFSLFRRNRIFFLSGFWKTVFTIPTNYLPLN